MSTRLLKTIHASLLAGDAIMSIYNSDDFSVEQKQDDSPLTLADKASHQILLTGLAEINKDPILSEEGAEIDWAERQTWDRYWLIDPLDGTKEFIKRNGEFTVNVALIEKGRPILGVVYAPALKQLYFAEQGIGSFKMDDISTEQLGINIDIDAFIAAATALQVIPAPRNTSWRIVGSRSHQSDAFKTFVAQFKAADIVSMGSSLKLCLVAEGKADLYPRLGLTSEWDTAAAQAVVEIAGGQVINVESGNALTYNQKESLLNPFFIVCSERSDQWSY